MGIEAKELWFKNMALLSIILIIPNFQTIILPPLAGKVMNRN